MGEIIKIKSRDGRKLRGYAVKPPKCTGPGLVLIPNVNHPEGYMPEMADRLAEEGYAVLVPELFKPASEALERLDIDATVEDIALAIKTLRKLDARKGKIGIVGFGLGGTLAFLTAARGKVDCAVSCFGSGIHSFLRKAKNIECPMLFHLAGDQAPAEENLRHAFRTRKDVEICVYRGAPAESFTSGLVYSRSLALLKRVMGPRFDLSSLWDVHRHHEFVSRDVDGIMATMAAEPQVCYVPTMTGAAGHYEVKRFYQNHFMGSNPEDMKLTLLSRTVGHDRIVDEGVLCFTHTREITWMLPGIKPTGKYVEIPLLAIGCFRGDRLYRKHVYWDQASVLAQIDVINTKGLPIAGGEVAKKLQGI